MGRNIDEITSLELLAIQADYESRELTVPELRKKYDISDIGLRTLRKRHEWRSRRQEPEPPPKRPVGRPRIYDSNIHPEQVKGLMLLGLTWKRVSEIMLIPEKTLKDWAVTYPEFANAVNFGRELSDVNVAKSLYDRATGYTFKELKLFAYQGEVIDERYVNKHCPPDVRAQEIWLRQRQPAIWRESKNVDFTDRTLRQELPGNDCVQDDADFKFLVEEQNTVNGGQSGDNLETAARPSDDLG